MSLHKRPVMSVDESIRRRRSVRGFLPDEVPERTLREVFELAQFAPSNCNVQPWTPHVVSGAKLKKLREALVEAGMRDEPVKPDWPAEGRFSGVHRERQVDAAQKLYGAMGVERRDLVGRKMAYIRNHAFFDAPHAVFIFMPEPFDTREATDIGMYAQTLMLALTARGIASCAQGALRRRNPQSHPAGWNGSPASSTPPGQSASIQRASADLTSGMRNRVPAVSRTSAIARTRLIDEWASARGFSGNATGGDPRRRIRLPRLAVDRLSRAPDLRSRSSRDLFREAPGHRGHRRTDLAGLLRAH